MKIADRFLVVLVSFCLPALAGQGQTADEPEIEIEIQADQPAHALSPVLYGVFYEDINYAGDGGLYAELVQNRSFEFYPVQGRDRRRRDLHPLYAWAPVELGNGACELTVDHDHPLNANNTRYVTVHIRNAGDGVGLRNHGFEGIPVTGGETYLFSVYARRTDSLQSPLQVTIEDASGAPLAQTEIRGLTPDWQKFQADLTVREGAEKASLVLVTHGEGEVCLDMISLFPQHTFRNRANGLRRDLAQAIAELKPATFRFPGGCIVHGHGLDNAYRWKDTIGDVAQRKPNWNLWGYHQSYGLGYFEYMQFCEDIGAEPLPILPLGISCGFRQPFQNADMADLQVWIDDALDLVEFANGPADSEWGRIRAAMGHPEPFQLKYIGLGNEEHHTPEFEERFPHFVDALRANYPEIQLVGTSGLGPGIPIYDFMSEQGVELSDEHYYMDPEWFIGNAHRFDDFDRTRPKIYVGEYGSHGNRLFNAVAEAVFLTGVERNGDIVHMTAYAPMLSRYEFSQWNPDLIWFDHQTVVRTPNYHVQRMFSTNKGDCYLTHTTTFRIQADPLPPTSGQVGVGTYATQAVFKDLSVTDGAKTLIEEDLTAGAEGWRVRGGQFSVSDQGYAQTESGAAPALSFHPTPAETGRQVISVQAMKTGGREGFLVVFGGQEPGHQYWWNVGGWGNSRHGVERVAPGGTRTLASTRGRIQSDTWYRARVEIDGHHIRCFLDDELIHDFTDEPEPPAVGISVARDDRAGEVILKVANPLEKDLRTRVRLQGASTVDREADVILLAGGMNDVNDLSQPDRIHPVFRRIPVSSEFICDIPAMSVQFIRMGVE